MFHLVRDGELLPELPEVDEGDDQVGRLKLAEDTNQLLCWMLREWSDYILPRMSGPYRDAAMEVLGVQG